MTYFYQVAGFALAVDLPDGWDTARLLPSFRPFRSEAVAAEELLFRLQVSDALPPDADPAARVETEATNDMGHVRLLRTEHGCRVETYYGRAEEGARLTHVIHFSQPIAQATAWLRPSDPHVSVALASLLRILYAQAIVRRQAVSIHAACVHLDGRAYLFLGKSGTGKSTHAALWRNTFADCHLLNDDNPTVRVLSKNHVEVYGTPWSGKTPCYRNAHFPLAGVVRLRQAAENHYTALPPVEAFVALLPSCMALPHDGDTHDALCQTLISMVECLPVGRLDCRPDEEAARLCHARLCEETSLHPKNDKVTQFQ